MRGLIVLGLAFVLSCGQAALKGGISTSDSGATGGAGGGSANSGIGGDCINEAFDAGPNSCSSSLPLPCRPCINCAPLQPGDDGGCAAPDISIFGWHGGGVDTLLRYPVGCQVYLPTQNPYYPGSPQPCGCQTLTGSAAWECPI